MTIRLRPHHLLCMLTYSGEGYNDQFCEGFANVLKRIENGEPIEIVNAPDDVCAPLVHEHGRAAHCYNASVEDRDAAAAAELAETLGMTVKAGSRLVMDTSLLVSLRTAFAKGQTRHACIGCRWWNLCTEIAENDFRTALIQPKPN